ncbi:4'-phosphopantetheine phosphatase [Phlebotomus argentipes]|uniref:4'-phosphopantetheine phosphatase n=1 Tax=Phlebotomus argentipes TaxID=94469 RepID=UPI0028937A01|nr:4'-phosphopantetheine phosphatase [Phlebotomus argentipes]XP_059610662.1 4'-phosphopantetheine phosphatase [Phlebotomus argentipes]
MFCPLLLDAKKYNPDTLNLTDDAEVRSYWFTCFRDLVRKFAIQARKSELESDDACKRAERFQQDFLNRMNSLGQSTETGDPITIRTLLDLNESCLRQHGFSDPWREQKILENKTALRMLRLRLDEVDKLRDNERWIELVRGLLAGNMFDWGAQAVCEILEANSSFGLNEALSYIQPRPWLIDGLDAWLARLQGSVHKCAAIFVDNSGFDIVLGILPFARELLRRGTKVILCANSEPALADITYKELESLMDSCCDQCSILREAYAAKRLLVLPNGQSGPCLNLRTLTPELSEAMVRHETDLLIIEGMGRALHTNLYAKFTCDTLKLAVVKNKWWANRLGGDTFSVICKYESAV